jgi:hypothetical protein
MMEAVRTSETSVDNHFTWQYIPEDNSEHHTRRRENLKSHKGSHLVAYTRTASELVSEHVTTDIVLLFYTKRFNLETSKTSNFMTKVVL